MYIRQASMEDLKEILHIYEFAREFQKQTGNPRQWAGGYPRRELVEEDIRQGNCCVCIREERLVGVFAFFTGEDPTYREIRGGAWLNDRPYGTIHRIAGNGTCKGMASFCFEWAMKRSSGNLRIDTHEDNRVMQHVLEKNGFSYCGEITASDGTPRRAYQKEQKIMT